MAAGKYTKSGGSSGNYTGPGSSLRANRKVGRGQDTKAEEKAEKKAETKENAAIKSLQAAQRMEKSQEKDTGAGQMPPGLMGARGMPPGMAPKLPGTPGGTIPPAGRRPGKVARRVPTMFRRGR